MNRPAWLLLLPGLLSACNTDTTAYKQPSDIVVDVGLVDFGVVTVGESATRTITLTHTQGDAVQVVGLELINHDGESFSTITDGFPLVPKDSTATVDVTYAPLTGGFQTALLTIRTDEEEGSNEYPIDLRGQSAAIELQAWPSLVDFGAVAVGDIATASVTVENIGTVDATVESATVVDADFASTASTPLVVPAGGSVELPLTFTPSTTSADETQLQILTSEGTTRVVTLRGNDCEHGDPARYDVDNDGYTTCGGDCDDTLGGVHPGATETCDTVDEDCDGVVDETTLCGDDDGDGYPEYSGDCNDADATISPDAEEKLDDGIDNNCDGIVDSGTTDDDLDGYSVAGGDCDDFTDTTHPGAAESANGVDDNCDGVVDEGTSAYDDDGDGVREEDGDCDDTSADTYPGAAERGDRVDNDCDGSIDEGTSLADDDGDGFTETGGDCDDADPAINPAELELSGNSIDDNCDGVTE